MPDFSLERVERLLVEEAQIRELAISSPSLYRFDDFNHQKGEASVSIFIPDRQPIQLKVRYPETFPFERPDILSDDPEVKQLRHVNRAGSLCTLRYEPDEWDPESTTTAELLPRVWKLLMRGGHLDRSEDDGTPEPLDFQTASDSPLIFVHEHFATALNDCEFGTGELVSEHSLVRFYVANLRSESTFIKVQVDPDKYYGLPDKIQKRRQIFWFKAAQSPPYTIASQEELFLLMPSAARTAALKAFPDLKKRKQGEFIFLASFEDDTGARWMAIRFQLILLKGYSAPRAKIQYMPTYIIGSESLYGRLEGLVDREKLEVAHVLIIGAGALGSEATFQLHRSGLGHLTVVDPDRVEVGNPVRSEYGLHSVGAMKVNQLKSRLEHHLPLADYLGISGKVPEARVMREIYKRHAVRPFSVILVAVGHHHLSRLIERTLLSFGIPTIYTWTTRGAAAGVVLTAGQGFGTYEDYHRLYMADQLPDLPSDNDLPNRYDRGCMSPALPAAPMDTRVVSNQAARTVLELASGERVPYLQMWTRKPHGQFPGLAWISRRLEELDVDTRRRPVADSLVIREVKLSYESMLQMEKLMRDQPEKETGGLLLGQSAAGCLSVELITRPGPNARRSANSFAMDDAYAQGWLDAMHQLKPELVYLGEWHSHPGGRLEPSKVDEQSALLLTNYKGTTIDTPLIMISRIDESGNYQGKAYVLQPNGILAPIEVILENYDLKK